MFQLTKDALEEVAAKCGHLANLSHEQAIAAAVDAIEQLMAPLGAKDRLQGIPAQKNPLDGRGFF